MRKKEGNTNEKIIQKCRYKNTIFERRKTLYKGVFSRNGRYFS